MTLFQPLRFYCVEIDEKEIVNNSRVRILKEMTTSLKVLSWNLTILRKTKKYVSIVDRRPRFSQSADC